MRTMNWLNNKVLPARVRMPSTTIMKVMSLCQIHSANLYRLWGFEWCPSAPIPGGFWGGRPREEAFGEQIIQTPCGCLLINDSRKAAM